jgi:capsular polysaccharide biosynthesis protein
MLSQMRAHWKAAVGIAAAVIASMAVAFVISGQTARTYTADARLVVTAGLGLNANGTDNVLEAPRLAQTYAVLALTRPVLLDVIQQADLPYEPDELGSRLDVTASLDNPFLTISMTDQDAVRAATVANTLAEVLVKRATVAPAGGGQAPLGSLLALVETATVPREPSGPRVAYNTLLAGMAVLVGGLAAVAGLAYLRNERRVVQTANR